MAGTAVTQVIAINAGDDDVFEPQCSDRLGEILRFVGIRRFGRPWPTSQNGQRRVQMSPHDHEGCRALAEAFTDVGAARLLAHRMQLVRAGFLISPKRAACSPVGALTRIHSGLQHRCADHLDRDPRCLAFPTPSTPEHWRALTALRASWRGVR